MVFCKTAAAAGSFRAEAAGLEALRRSNTVRVPAVLEVSEEHLLTEFIRPGTATSRSWRQLGEELARLHSQAMPEFGFDADNFCGATPQPNPRMEDGYRFFAEARLLYQGRLARDAGLLELAQLERLEQLCLRLPELLPEQAPALLHGDLWRGNLLFDPAGDPWLIDPAVYWGWPETDLAMTALFGGFDDAFYTAYDQATSLPPGWRERLPLYNLYHLLNHLNLFGGTYHGAVVEILSRFA